MAYEHFYQYYDSLMEDVPYDQFIEIVNQYAKNTDKILDLGCGTGTVLINLLKQGYTVDGVDISDEMLMATQNKLYEHNLFAHLFQDDMSEINIKDEYNVIVSFLDSINYITNEEDLKNTFANVYQALQNNGYFIFDVHSLNKVHHVFDGYSYCENRDEFSYLWNTFVDINNDYSVLYHELTFFIKENNGYFKKLDEFHKQVIYPLDFYKQMLEKSQFKIEKIMFDLDGNNCEASCDRIFFIVQKKD